MSSKLFAWKFLAGKMSVDKKQALLQKCADLCKIMFGKNNWNIPLKFLECYITFFLFLFFFFLFVFFKAFFLQFENFLWQNSPKQNGVSHVSLCVRHCLIRNVRSSHFHCTPEEKQCPVAYFSLKMTRPSSWVSASFSDHLRAPEGCG